MHFLQNHYVNVGNAGTVLESPDDGGDTELATDDDNEDFLLAGGHKRSSQRSAGTRIKCVDSFL